MATNDADAREILQEEAAASGEQLLWWGRPAAGRVALQALPASIFGIPFTGFAFFWILAAAGSLPGGRRAESPGLLFPLFGLPFVAVGLGLLLSPLFAALGARRTLYAITTGGVLIVKAGRARRVERFPLPGDDVMSRSQRADGSGDLVVAHREVSGRGRTYVRPVTFLGISDVAKVGRIVADARSRAPSARATPHAPTAPRAPADSLPSYRATEGRRLPASFLLTDGLVIGFVAALLLAGAGKLPLPRPAAQMPGPTAEASAPSDASGPRPQADASASRAAPPPVSPVAAPATGEPACDAGGGASCLRAARARYERGARAPTAPDSATDRALGVALAARGCDLGSADGCASAGFALAYGKPGLPPEPARAEPLLDRACAEGHHPRACAALGDLLAKRGELTRARTVLSGCCAFGDGGCCTSRDRL